MLGPRGLIDARGTWWVILAAHLCFNLAVVLRTVGAALGAIDPDLEPAARLLGASPVGAAWRVVLPVVAPAVAAAGIIVFLFCLTSFGVIVILGGGVGDHHRGGDLDPGDPSVRSVRRGCALPAAAARRRGDARGPRPGGSSSGGPGRLRGPDAAPAPGAGQRLAVVGAAAAVVVVSVLPLVALLERSLRTGDTWSLANWRGLGSAAAGTGLQVSPWDAVAVSMLTSSAATALAMALALPAVRVVARRPGGASDRVLLLPLGVSSTTIGLGLLLAVGRPPLDLRGSWWLVPVAQALVALPLVVRVVLPALRAIPASVLDGAALLGVGPSARWWRVELPLVRRSIAAGAGLALVACLGEFGATVFLARSSRPTVPVAIERLMSRPGGAGFGQAMALSCVLVVLCGAVIALVDRWLAGDDNELAF